MLRGIKKASANWLGKLVLGVIMSLLVVSFAIWGIGDIFRGFGRSTVAKVGRTEITIEQFRQTFNERLRQIGTQLGRPITMDQARAIGLDQQVLGQVVAETALDERARQLGLGLPDAEVAKQITGNPDFRGFTGQFDRTLFERRIRDNGFTEARYIAEVRRRTLQRQLAQTISGGLPTPKTAIDALNRYENEQRSIEYIKLGSEQAGDVPAPPPDVLAKYFEERKVIFRAPEYRKLALLALTPADAALWIEVSDDDARRIFEERRERYSTPDRRQIQQIIFANVEEARAAADRIGKGQTFAALTAERGLQPADIDLGLVTKSAIIDRAVAEAAFALQEGGVSEPVQGRFGTVLLHVVKIEPGQTRSFEEIAPQLKRDISLERARDEVRDRHDKIEDERLAGGTLAEIAQRLGLQVRTIEAVDRSGRAPDGSQVRNLPQGADVLTAAFAAQIGADNDALRAGDGYVWYDVADITPARERELEEVKDQVETRWRDDEISARLRAKTAEMVDEAKAGARLNEVAAKHGLQVETATGVKRSTRSEALSPKMLEVIFRTAKDMVTTAEGERATERIVFRVTEVNVPSIDMAAPEAKQIGDNLQRSLTNDIFGQYIARLESEIGTTINQSALNQVVGSGAN